MFIDRIVEHPNRVKLEPVSGNIYDMTREEGTVTEEGTPLNSSNLINNINELIDAKLSGVTIDSNGNLSARNFQSGSASVTPTSGTPTTKAITFPKPFSSAPRVVLTPVTGVPQNVSLGVSGITTTGFNIVIYRNSATNTTVNWLAML